MAKSLSGMGLIVFPYLYYYARDLATRSTSRNAVKMGLRIMSLCAEPRSINIAMMLGRHEEFGDYAATMIINVGASRNIRVNEKLFRLVERLHGWGRIITLKKIAGFIEKRHKDWIFFKGYQNNISVMETALYASAYGNLDARLEPAKISRKTYDAATDLIKGLLERDIEYYKPVLTTFGNYIRHSCSMDNTVMNYYVLHEMLDFLKNKHKADSKENIAKLTKILSNKKVKTEIIKTAAMSNAHIGRWYADKLARIYKVNLFNVYWNLLQSNKADENIWYYVMESANQKDTNKILDLADQVIIYGYIATGPTNKIFAHGPEYFQHNILGYIIQGLGALPNAARNDISWKLIMTALNNPIINIRNGAINAIEKWGKDKIPSGIKIELKKQIKKETDSEIIDRLKNLQKQDS